MSVNVPADLKYAKSHEWVRREGATATIGITDHAQHELTDVVFVELPALGRKISGGRILRRCGIGQNRQRYLLARQRRSGGCQCRSWPDIRNWSIARPYASRMVF